MAILQNSAEGQPPGTAISSSMTGGGSGDAFSSGSSGGTYTAVFSNTQAMHGSQSYAITANVTFANYTSAWTAASASSGAFQAYFFFTGYPASSSVQLMQVGDPTTKSAIAITSTGTINFLANVTVYTTSMQVSLNTWYRLDLCVTSGATTTDGRVQASISLGDSPTPLESYDSGLAVNTGISPYTKYTFGKATSNPAMPTFYVDDLKVDSGATSLIGPPDTSVPFPWVRM